MSFDSGSLLRQTSQEIIDGLANTRGSFANVVCTNLTRDAIKGTEPYRASKDSLSGASGREAIGSDPSEANFALSSLNWDMGRFHKMTSLDESEIVDLKQYMDPLTAYLETLKDFVDAGVDVELAALLVNASFNGSHAAAAGNWSVASSTPVLDMQEAKRTDSPDADMCIIGEKSAYELARHPEFKEAVSHYSGGGAISFGSLKAGIGQVLNIPASGVHVFGTFYDSANEAQALNLAYAADELCWIGSKRGLIKLEQPGSGKVSVETKHLTTEISYARTLDLQRVDSQLGTYITGL